MTEFSSLKTFDDLKNFAGLKTMKEKFNEYKSHQHAEKLKFFNDLLEAYEKLKYESCFFNISIDFSTCLSAYAIKNNILKIIESEITKVTSKFVCQEIDDLIDQWIDYTIKARDEYEATFKESEDFFEKRGQ